MKNSEMDPRTKNDILDYIEKAAIQYTPEWRFDRENPDAGTALAGVYADMFSKMLGKFNRVLDKNMVEFFNSIDANVLPPVPASGYAVFHMVNDTVAGAEIESGINVYADTAEGKVAFQTKDDVYATSSQIQEIYQVWDQRDMIKHVFSSEQPAGFTLFDTEGKNLQQHEMYFAHDMLFRVKHEATIELILYVRGDVPVSEKYMQLFVNPEYAIFEYYTANGFEQMRPSLSDDNHLIFHKEEYMPAFERTEINNIESCFIRCRISQMVPFENFSFENFYITTKGAYLTPDVVNGNGIDCNLAEYTPFGERFGLYNEVYFACEEALSKAGSRIEFAFTMDFARIPLTDITDDGIEWDWVMKKSDFKVDSEYDVTIAEVLWEYYNGSGWSRLFADSSYADIFSTQNGLKAQYRTMRFTCPDDIVPLLVNSCESYYIRARIIKINNLYKNKGYYVSPMLSDTVFSYDYANNWKTPQWVCTYNNLEMCTYKNGMDKEKGFLKPFHMTGLRENTLYLGFSQPITLGPVKILFAMTENLIGTRAQLRWEYYSSRGFTEANLIDETDSFSKTGIVTIMDSPDFRSKSLFGKKLYWMRIVDEGNYYARVRTDMVYPCVQDIHMNAVRISNVDFSEIQYFSTEQYEENRHITLLHPKVIDLSVWVDEGNHISPRQIQELKQQYEVDCVYDDLGMLQNVWVKWAEVSDFVGMDSQSRCFQIDRNEGVITFGSGRYGKIIPVSRQENIKVLYRCGGGKRTNLEPNSIQRMEYAVGFVSSVSNPYKVLGGCDQETVQEAMIRNSQLLKNHYKAVTSEDFEHLVRCSSRHICRAKCFTGYDAEGHHSPGCVTLVVLQHEFQSGRYVFNEIKNQVYQYLSDKIDGNLLAAYRLFIIEPEFAEVCVRLELMAVDFNVVFRMRKQIMARLSQFLNPLTGHFDGNGWEIGTLPSVIQLQNLLRDIHGVKYIKNVYLSLYITDYSGRTEIDPKRVSQHPFILPVNGSHEIIIKVE